LGEAGGSGKAASGAAALQNGIGSGGVVKDQNQGASHSGKICVERPCRFGTGFLNFELARFIFELEQDFTILLLRTI
jgi:hypothetical protein